MHLQLKPNTDVVLINSLMNVILSEEPARPGVHRRARRPGELRGSQGRGHPGKYTPENTAGGDRSRPGEGAQGRSAARQAEQELAPVREGRDLVGHAERRGHQQLRQPRAAAWLGRAARAGLRPPGRPPERLHVRLRLGRTRRPATCAATSGRSSPPARSACSSSRSQSPADAAAVHAAARVRQAKVPFVVDINIRPSDTSAARRRRAPRSGLGRVHLHAREPRAAAARQPAVLRPAGRGRPRIPDLRPHRPEDRRQVRHPRSRRSGRTPPGRTSSTACARPSEAQGRRHRPDHAAGARVARHERHPGADQAPGQHPDRHRARVRGQVRHRRTARPASSPTTTAGPPPTRSRSCPSRSSPTRSTRFFVTTVRYQTVWQSGYTYRCLKRPRRDSVPYMEIVVQPEGRQEGRT